MLVKLYRAPSLIGAKNKEEVEEILLRKIDEYENDTGMLVDYIANSFNNLQRKENEMLYARVEIDQDLKKVKAAKDEIKNFISNSLSGFGIDVLKDSSSVVGSSVSIVPKEEIREEIKDIPLTMTEMKELLKANGLPTTKLETAIIPSKPASIKINYRQGKRISQLTQKAAKEEIEKTLKPIEGDESEH